MDFGALSEQENSSSRQNTLPSQKQEKYQHMNIALNLRARGLDSFSKFVTPMIDEDRASVFSCENDDEEFSSICNVDLSRPLAEHPLERSGRKERPRRQTIATNVSQSTKSSRSKLRASLDGKTKAPVFTMSDRLTQSTRSSQSKRRPARGDNPLSRSMDGDAFKQVTASAARSRVTARASSSSGAARPTSSAGLSRTASDRMNRLDVKCKEAEAKLKKCETQVEQLKEQNTILKQHNSAMKHELTELRAFRRKNLGLDRELQKAKLAHSTQIRDLESKNKVLQRELNLYKQLKLQSLPQSSDRGATTKSVNQVSPRMSATGESSGPEAFQSHNALPVFAHDVKKSAYNSDIARRSTMAPGEVSRMRRSKTNSRNIKITGLRRGFNSQSLYNLLSTYGDVLVVKVTKDIFTDVLIGYGTFESPSTARKAVEGLRQHGHNATITANEA